MKKTLAAILFALILFTGFHHPATNAIVANRFLPQGGPKMKVTINKQYSMMIPEYLSRDTTLNDEASLQYSNYTKEMYIVVIDESKKDFKDVFLALGDYDTTKTVLQNYTRAQMESIRANMQAITKESPLRYLRTGSGKAHVHDVTGTQEGVDGELGFTIGFVEGKETLYMIMMWTFQKDKPLYQEDMDAMITSFREL